tara:strand:- start:867 stop:1211 length:345 start_codon:yes stop_codon:yes gene_type:complete
MRSRYGRRSSGKKDMYGRLKVWKDDGDDDTKQGKVSHVLWMESHGIVVKNIHDYVATEDHNSMMFLINAFGKTISIDSTLDEKRTLAFECLKKASRPEVVKACKTITSDKNYSK